MGPAGPPFADLAGVPWLVWVVYLFVRDYWPWLVIGGGLCSIVFVFWRAVREAPFA